MASELKPCPFCGGKASIERKGDRSMSTIYSCDWCGCSLETGEEWDHGKAWNTRPAPAATDTGLETVSDTPIGMLRAFGACDIREGSRAILGNGIEEDEWEPYLEVPVHVLEKMLAELVARSQAEELLAAERAKYRDAMEKLVESQRETLVWQQRAIDLKADNAAKDKLLKEANHV